MNSYVKLYLEKSESSVAILFKSKLYSSSKNSLAKFVSKSLQPTFFEGSLVESISYISNHADGRLAEIKLPLGLKARFIRWFGYVIVEFECSDRTEFINLALKSTEDLPRKVKKEVRASIGDVRQCHFDDAVFNAAKDIVASAIEKKSYWEEREMLQATLHEIQTPISSLRSHIDLMGGAGSELSDSLNFIRMHLERMTTILNQDLKFSPNSFVYRNPGAFINELKSRYQAAARLKGIKVQVEKCNVDIKFIPHRFEAALSNILANAIKYSSINRNPANHTANVIVDFMVKDRELLITVSNNGQFIEPQDISSGKIFEKGKRAGQEARIPGTGLGLYVSKKIIEEEHLGRLKIESKRLPDREGLAKTTVTISLPI